jgi:anti-sigma factor RsiW
MLTCREVTGSASRLIDGELTFRERLGVRVHLVVCGHCRRFVRQLQRLVDSLSLRPSPSTPQPADEFVERVMQALPLGSSGYRSGGSPPDPA